MSHSTAPTCRIKCVMACVKDGVTLDAAETFFVPVFLLGSSTLGIENLKYVYNKNIETN